jgi:hypothetical protein
VLVLAGCNQVWNLDRTDLVDAKLPDFDGDNVDDAHDNCADVANSDQADADGDQTGDLCDDCPLVANAQGVDRDGDNIGDACDPHPDKVGDCLLVFDTFGDPNRFSESWQIMSTNSTPIVTPEVGDVVLHHQPGFNLAIAAIGIDGLVNLEVKARSATGNATIIAAAGMSASMTGYWCELQEPEQANVVVSLGPSCTQIFSRLVPPVVGAKDAFLRLYVEDTGTSVTTSCRAEFGFSVGTASSPSCAEITGGAAGVIAAGEDVEIDAVAIQRYQPGTQCLPTAWR